MEKEKRQPEIKRDEKLRVELYKTPKKGATIIEGFPGFGFVSTIVTEYLIKHTGAISIGQIISNKLQPVAAIHENKVINPLEIFYSAKQNLVFVQAVTPIDGLEWEIADAIQDLCQLIGAKEVIGLEGVGSSDVIKNPQAFFFTANIASQKAIEALKLLPLKEGIIVGVTGALMIKKKLPLSCFFIETNSKLPDNFAAAKIIEILDGYLHLKVDPKPLLTRAKDFQDKLKKISGQLNSTNVEKYNKELSYMG